MVDDFGASIAAAADEGESGLAFYQSREAGVGLSAMHGIGFEVSDLSAGLDLYRACFNADARGDVTASGGGAFASVSSSAAAQELEELAPVCRLLGVLFVQRDEVIDGGVTDAHRQIIGMIDGKPSADLHGRPAELELVQEVIAQRRIGLQPWHRLGRPAPLNRSGLGMKGVVMTSLLGIACPLAIQRGPMPLQDLRGEPRRMPRWMNMRDMLSFDLTDMRVGHGESPVLARKGIRCLTGSDDSPGHFIGIAVALGD